MAILASRNDLKAYILRRLGSGVVDVEITEEQIQDIIDDTLQRFSEEVQDGVEEVISLLNIPKNSTEITLGDDIMGINDVFYSTGKLRKSDSLDPFDYNVYMSDIWKNLYNTDGTVQTMYITKSYFEELRDMFNSDLSFSFNHQTKKLTLLQNVPSDTILAMTVYKNTLDDNKIWNHQFIKKYSTGLAWNQWGDNISKYNGSVLVGGMTINSDNMKQNAETLLQEAEDNIQDKWTTPLGIFLG